MGVGRLGLALWSRPALLTSPLASGIDPSLDTLAPPPLPRPPRPSWTAPPGLRRSSDSLVPPSSPKSGPRLSRPILGSGPGLLDPAQEVQLPPRQAPCAAPLGPPPNPASLAAGTKALSTTVTCRGNRYSPALLWTSFHPLYTLSLQITQTVFQKNLKFKSQSPCPQAKDVAEGLEGVFLHLADNWLPSCLGIHI